MTIFRLKQLASTSFHAATGAVQWNYDRGELIAEGDAPTIRADARVREVYLGSGVTSGGH